MITDAQLVGVVTTTSRRNVVDLSIAKQFLQMNRLLNNLNGKGDDKKTYIQQIDQPRATINGSDYDRWPASHIRITKWQHKSLGSSNAGRTINTA